MAKKRRPPEEGAPAWLLTYGDMITLVLCFFVLLFSMSEVRKDKIQKTMRAFQAQFGVLPRYKSTVQVFVQAKRMTQTEANILRRGPMGKHMNVQIIDPGKKMKMVLGGKSLFREDDYHLTSEGKRMIQESICPDIRGFENKIEIRGHAASAPAFKDVWEISYRRAMEVMRFLVDECGIEERRCRVVACGDTEPIKSNLTPEGREENRRVEVVMTEEFLGVREARRQPQ
ncbi:MAG: flagellar motor protein MotB [Planctomycetota bacterium]